MVRPHLGADTGRSARRLSRLCGYLPLTLRIAAANLAERSYWTIEGYADELETGDRLSLLATPGHSDSSIGTVRFTSYQKLEPLAQLMFRRLGLMPGASFSGDAVAVLLEADAAQALSLLETLASAHLVEPVGPRLFALHDLVGLFARGLAREREPDGPDTVDRLLRWYLDSTINVVEVMRPNMIRLPDHLGPGVTALSFPDIGSARAWLDSERGNLVAAIALAAEDEGLRRHAWLIADAMRGYFLYRYLGCSG